MVTSDSMNHAWNLIKLGENYYQVDVTWDDPTWDIIGRARHEYMFRSDDAFQNKCEHKEWIVTKGSENVTGQFAATDTSYDDAFWLTCDSPLVLVGDDCYYTAYDETGKTGVINKTKLSGITEKGTMLRNIGMWMTWDKSGYWPGVYSGLFYANGRLYYNDATSIRSFAFDDAGVVTDERVECEPGTTDGYIYGIAFCQGNVLYALHQSPNFGGRETVLTADITIKTEEPPDEETFTVTFNLQGHGTALGEYASYTGIKKGSAIKNPTSPTAEGYEFTGWYKEAGCQTLWDFDKDTVEGNTTLYAGWKSSGTSGETPGEKPEEKPVLNSVLFPGKKSEYSAAYTGEQIRPAMTVAYQYTDADGRTKTQKLKQNVDYTVYYSNNIDAGENNAQVTVRGIGEYTGVVTRKFTITAKDIKSAALSPVGDIVYGARPSVGVTDGSKELVEGRDYRIILSTEGSADADTQSELTVDGIGNYSGKSTKKMKFNILRAGTELSSIASGNIKVEFKNAAKTYSYNGKAQKPGVAVTDTSTGKKVSSSMYKVVYSNNVNAGKGTAKAWVVGVSKNGKGYYGVSEPLYFDIGQKSFNKVSASLNGTIPKTGTIEDIRKAIGEALVVKDAKHVFSEDEYTINYGQIETVDGLKIGTKYPITLTPRAGGNYTADSAKVVNIKFGQLNLASKTANISVKVTNAAQNATEFRYNGILLEQNRDYTATVKKEKHKDTYTVKIKAAKNSAYKGSRTVKNVELKKDEAGENPGNPDKPEDGHGGSRPRLSEKYRADEVDRSEGGGRQIQRNV